MLLDEPLYITMVYSGKVVNKYIFQAKMKLDSRFHFAPINVWLVVNACDFVNTVDMFYYFFSLPQNQRKKGFTLASCGIQLCRV